MSANDNPEPKKKPELLFVVYNVAMTYENDSYEKTAWANRRDRIVNLVSSIGADVMCLHGLSKVPGCETPERFLESLEELGYHWHLEYADEDAGAYGQATLWKSDSYRKMETRSARIRGGRGPGGTLLTGCKLGSNAYPGCDFWILNSDTTAEPDVLFGEAVADFLGTSAEAMTGGERFLFGLGVKDPDVWERTSPKYLSGTAWDTGSPTSSQKLKACKAGDETAKKDMMMDDLYHLGTLVGYDHNPEKASTDPSTGSIRPESRKTRVMLSSRVIPASVPILHTETMLPTEPPEFGGRDLPSEHLPLAQRVRIGERLAEGTKNRIRDRTARGDDDDVAYGRRGCISYPSAMRFSRYRAK